MTNKKIMIYTMSVLIITTLLLVGLSYAYFRTRIIENKAEESINVSTKLLEVKYNDNSATIQALEIEPGYTVTKSFSVKNTGTDNASYSIKFDNLNNNFTRPDFTYILTKEGVIEPIASGTILANVSNDIQVIAEQRQIAVGETDNYLLTIKYENLTEDQSIDMGASLSLRVNIGEEIVSDNLNTGLLLSKIKENNKIEDPITTPGRVLSSETEAVLSSAEDDYGTSYYFRGAVTNNYINYSGMCWRIVRIQGNDTIKIVLEDENNLCESVTSTTSAFINGEETVEYSSLNTADYTYSNIPHILNDWAKKIDISKLENTKWCNDLSLVDNSAGLNDRGQLEWVPEYCHIWWEHYDYKSYTRLFSRYDENTSYAKPSLKCDQTGINNTFALQIESNIGILTADELAFAGEIYNQRNNNCYLNTNTSGNKYWTMSPCYINHEEGNTNYICTMGSTLNASNYNTKASIRPVVNLKSDVTVTTKTNIDTFGLPGTITNPYIVS